MRPEFAVIPDDIIRYCMNGFAEADIAGHRYPFVFQASEEALHRAVDAPMSRAAIGICEVR